MLKKIFVIVIVLFLTVVIFWGIYVFFVKDDGGGTTEQLQEVTPEVASNRPTGLTEKFTNISSFAILDFGLLEGTDQMRVWTKSGTILDMTLRGTNETEVKKLSLEGVEGAIWSPTGTEVLIRMNNGVTMRYNPSEKELVQLRGGLDFVEWADIEGRIIYKYFDQETGERSLNVADSNGLNLQKLANIDYRDVTFAQIPESSHVAFWPAGDAFEQTRLSTVSIFNPTTPEIHFADLFGADYLFSPDGKKMLISSTLDKGGSQITLGVASADGGSYQNLRIPTVVQKAVWSNDNKTVYYALPNDIPPGSVMPNDYKEGKFTTRDTIWKVDVTTGKADRIITPQDITEKIDATNLTLTPEEDALLFINRTNQLLYRMNF